VVAVSATAAGAVVAPPVTDVGAVTTAERAIAAGDVVAPPVTDVGAGTVALRATAAGVAVPSPDTAGRKRVGRFDQVVNGCRRLILT
jgi:hypothetical protein